MSLEPRPEAIETHNLLDQLVYAVGLVDFKEKSQEWFCHVCCYRDPIGTRLHADGCRYRELSRQLDTDLATLAARLRAAESEKGAATESAVIMAEKLTVSEQMNQQLRSLVHEGKGMLKIFAWTATHAQQAIVAEYVDKAEAFLRETGSEQP